MRSAELETEHMRVHDAATVSEIDTRAEQAVFFDENPPLYPWPWLLRSSGLTRAYKPREAMWRQELENIEMQFGERVLDVGCGTGIWLDRLAGHFGAVGTGVDVSLGSLREASRRAKNRLDLCSADAPVLPFEPNCFDFVLCLDVLEHIVDQQSSLHEMARVLRPEGRLFLWTLNRDQRFTWNWWLDKLGVDVYDRSAHDPGLLPDPTLVTQWLDQSEMRLERIRYFNSFFTLALDEAIMISVSILKRLGIFQPHSKLSSAVGKIFLFLADQLSKRTLRVLDWLDRPWKHSGRSNGFLIIARKSEAFSVGAEGTSSLRQPVDIPA